MQALIYADKKHELCFRTLLPQIQLLYEMDSPSTDSDWTDNDSTDSYDTDVLVEVIDETEFR